MPIGAPRAGGSPAGRPTGGLIPRCGGSLEVVLLGAQEWVGSPVLVGIELGLQHCWQEQQLQQLLQCLFPAESFISYWDGPPTPRTGPPNPVAAWGMGAAAGTPLPAAWPSPASPAAAASGV